MKITGFNMRSPGNPALFINLLPRNYMKHFTESDIRRPESDSPHIYLGEYRDNLADCPLWWHTQGLSQTATGYGAKLTSRYKIHFEGKLYRLYTICFSNAGTTYFTVKGRRIYVS